MKTLPFVYPKETKRIVINQGEFYVTDKSEIISTLLGSCVAACLYDPVKKVIGMNHFLLAENNFKTSTSLFSTTAGRFGIDAMELLINGMLKKGALKKNLKAKCFGGGAVLQSNIQNSDSIKNVSQLNIEFIYKFLKKENIELVNSSLGGDHGRKIHFVGDDHSVYVQKILIDSKSPITTKQKLYWNETRSSSQDLGNKIQTLTFGKII